MTSCSGYVVIHVNRSRRNPHYVLSQSQDICRNALTAEPEQTIQCGHLQSRLQRILQPFTGCLHFPGNLLVWQWCVFIRNHTPNTVRQMIPVCIRYTGKTSLQAVHAAKPFIVEHHIFLADAPFFTQRSKLVVVCGLKADEKVVYVIHIQQGNTQPFFWSGLCLSTLLQNIQPLPVKAWRFIQFCKTVFIRKIVNSCMHTEDHSV